MLKVRAVVQSENAAVTGVYPECLPFGLILHTPGPDFCLHVAYIYIDTLCAYPPPTPSIRFASSFNSAQLAQLIKLSKISIFRPFSE